VSLVSEDNLEEEEEEEGRVFRGFRKASESASNLDLHLVPPLEASSIIIAVIIIILAIIASPLRVSIFAVTIKSYSRMLLGRKRGEDGVLQGKARIKIENGIGNRRDVGYPNCRDQKARYLRVIIGQKEEITLREGQTRNECVFRTRNEFSPL